MYGTLNHMAALSILVIKEGNDLTVGITGLAGLTTLVIVIVGLFAYDRLLAKKSIMLS